MIDSFTDRVGDGTPPVPAIWKVRLPPAGIAPTTDEPAAPERVSPRRSGSVVVQADAHGAK